MHDTHGDYALSIILHFDSALRPVCIVFIIFLYVSTLRFDSAVRECRIKVLWGSQFDTPACQPDAYPFVAVGGHASREEYVFESKYCNLYASYKDEHASDSRHRQSSFRTINTYKSTILLLSLRSLTPHQNTGPLPSVSQGMPYRPTRHALLAYTACPVGSHGMPCWPTRHAVWTHAVRSLFWGYEPRILFPPSKVDQDPWQA